MEAKKKYGLISGFLFAAWQYIEYFSGLHKSEMSAYSAFIPAPLFVLFLFLAIKQKRRELGGYIDFADGLKTGLGVSALAGIIYSISFYIYCKWVNPGWILEKAAEFRRNLLAQTNSKNIDQQVQDFIENFAFRSSMMVMVMLLFFGGIVSVIMAAIIKRKPPVNVV